VPAGPGSSLILVVEGEWLTRQTVVGEFQLPGWEIPQAETGEDAIARTRDVGDWMEIVFTVGQSRRRGLVRYRGEADMNAQGSDVVRHYPTC
jgi:hypothetical protein